MVHLNNRANKALAILSWNTIATEQTAELQNRQQNSQIFVVRGPTGHGTAAGGVPDHRLLRGGGYSYPSQPILDYLPYLTS